MGWTVVAGNRCPLCSKRSFTVAAASVFPPVPRDPPLQSPSTTSVGVLQSHDQRYVVASFDPMGCNLHINE